MDPGNLHAYSIGGLSLLMHDVITLSGATLYDKL